MTPPINIDGTNENYNSVTIDGQTVEQITIDGQDVLDAIPDSDALHSRYDFGEYSGTSGFDDLTGNGRDLTNGSITGVSESINGFQAGEFNGVNDEVSSNTFSTISQPITTAIVLRLDDETTENAPFALHDTQEINTRWYDGDNNPPGNWRMFAGDVLDGTSGDSTIKILTSVYDGANSLIRIDGTQIASGDGGTQSSNRNTVGFRPDNNSSFFDGAIGEILVYPDRRTSSEINDIEQYLADEWGVTL